MTYAWHFTDGMKLRDDTPLEVRRYEYEGDVVMCVSGYHWSRDPLDALRYAPGFTLSRVRVDDIVEERDDKGVSRVREVLEVHDVRDVVLLWASDVAEHAVRRYYTGNSDAPQEAIDTVRAHVRGGASSYDCRRAAYTATGATAYAAGYAADAAYTAAGAAAYAAYATYRADAAADAGYAAYAAYAAADAAYTAAGVGYAAADAADAAASRLLRIRLREVFTIHEEDT